MPSTFFTPIMAEVGPRSLQKTKTHALQSNDLRCLLEEEDPRRPRVAPRRYEPREDGALADALKRALQRR